MRIKFTDLRNVNDVHELRGINLEYWITKRLHARALKTIADHHRYLCGCATADVHSAWVSYAEGYRGVCFGFAVLPESRFPVSYTVVPHDVDVETRGAMLQLDRSKLESLVREIRYGYIDADEAVENIFQYALRFANVQVICRHILSTKSTEWAHEKEVRVARKLETLDNDFAASLFGEGMELKQVIAGPRTDEGLHELRSLVSDLKHTHGKHVRLIELTEKGSNSYELGRRDVNS